jgi:hypothetical protein
VVAFPGGNVPVPVSNDVTPQSWRGYRPDMTTVIKAVSFDAADALALATFWAALLGSDVDEDSSADKAFVEAAGWGGPNIWFTRVPEAKAAKNRMHFDLRAPGAVADEVIRLEKLGATVQRACRTRNDRRTAHRSTRQCGSWHGGLWVLVDEEGGRVVVDERVVGEPLNRAAAGTGIAEGVPRRQQLRGLLLQLGFEPAEGTLALDGARQSPPGSLVAELISEVGHVLVPDVGRQRIDADQIRLVEVDGCLAADPGVGCPDRDFSSLRIDQPPVFVVGLVGQRVSDLLQVEAAQLKHRARIDPCSRQQALTQRHTWLAAEARVFGVRQRGWLCILWHDRWRC